MTIAICALPNCDRPVPRSNQDYCCPAHKQRAYRQRNQAAHSRLETVTSGQELHGDPETVTRRSALPTAAPVGAETALEWVDPVFPDPKQPEMCRICGEVFYPGALRQRLCSPGCRRHAYLERMRAAKIGASEACLRCGEPFIRKEHEESPFCGTFCRWIFERQTPVSDPDSAVDADALSVGTETVTPPLVRACRRRFLTIYEGCREL